MKKTIVITGATGFIGGELSRFFLNKEYHLKGFTRSPEKTKKLENLGIHPVLWDTQSLTGWETELENTDAVINLAGESIATGRLTDKKKKRILNSRVDSVKVLAQALEQVKNKPEVVVQASGIGFYGSRGDEELQENAAVGQGIFADAVKQWEDCTDTFKRTGVRLVILRLGMVLGKDKGALKPMTMPFRFFIGGPLGLGKQWMSWVHILDVARAIDFLISHKEYSGIYNLTAPHPVRNKEFARNLGNVLHRPSFFPVPAFMLKLMLGEMANELLLTSQRVLPARLLEAGFTFDYPHLEPALNDLFINN
jgi:uncharacterized protein (TIGR01777 family)